MPKRRKDEDKIKHYQEKIRRLVRRNRRTRTPSTESECYRECSDRDLSPQDWAMETENNTSPEHEIDDDDHESVRSVVVPVPNRDLPLTDKGNNIPTQTLPASTETAATQEAGASEPALDDEILKALGDIIQDKPKFGPPINGDLAQRWMAIAKSGLDKDTKEKLFKDYLIPENCPYFQAPKLNPEIIASISDTIKNRDKKIESGQQQLGHGIAALSQGLSLLITNTSDKLTIIKILSDASKMLTDLHYNETVGRKKLITPLLDKKFIDITKDIERDDFLYGQNLSEKIKSMNNVLRSGQSIKKTDKTGGNNFRKQGGNYSGPPRPQTKPSYRSGPRRPMEPNHRPYKAPPQPIRKKPDPKPPARK